MLFPQVFRPIPQRGTVAVILYQLVRYKERSVVADRQDVKSSCIYLPAERIAQMLLGSRTWAHAQIACYEQKDVENDQKPCRME